VNAGMSWFGARPGRYLEVDDDAVHDYHQDGDDDDDDDDDDDNDDDDDGDVDDDDDDHDHDEEDDDDDVPANVPTAVTCLGLK
jgi:hypothetical protein